MLLIDRPCLFFRPPLPPCFFFVWPRHCFQAPRQRCWIIGPPSSRPPLIFVSRAHYNKTSHRPTLKQLFHLTLNVNQRLLWAAHGWMFPFASVSKRVFVQAISHKNELMNLQVQVIRMVLHLDSSWRRGKRQLGHGLLDVCRKCSWIKREEEYHCRIVLASAMENRKRNIWSNVMNRFWCPQYGCLLTPFRWLNLFSGEIVL